MMHATLPAAAPPALRSRSSRRRSARVCASGAAAGTPQTNVPLVKEFLAALPSLGSVRLIVQTGTVVLESVTTFEGLFYSPVPGKGEYGNLIKSKENVDMHLLVDKLACVKLVSSPGRGGDYTSHVLRFQSHAREEPACLSVFLMWPEGAARGAYADGQVAAFQALEAKYGTELNLLL